jgi:hypothetical protein
LFQGQNRLHRRRRRLCSLNLLPHLLENHLHQNLYHHHQYHLMRLLLLSHYLIHQNHLLQLLLHLIL